MKNHTPIFVTFTILLIAIRWILNDISSLVLVNAFINVAALLFVFFTITETAIIETHTRIENTAAPNDIVIREKKRTKNIIYFISYSIYVLIATVYLIWGACEMGNDIISIASLGLSLISQDIATCIAKNIKL